MNLKLIEEGEVIRITRANEQDSIVYSIRKSELGNILIINETNYSDWINQLLSKKWITNDILYKLANKIQIEFPANQINWEAQFFIIERKEYLAYIQELKNELNNTEEKKKSLFERRLQKIKIGQEEQDVDIKMKVEEIVAQKLKDYGIRK